MLGRRARDANGHFDIGAPSPNGYPSGHGKQVMKDAGGQPTDLDGRAIGAVIEVLVNHDAGTLGYRVNDGPLLEALTGFPAGAALRPWAWAGIPYAGDCLSVVRPYL